MKRWLLVCAVLGIMLYAVSASAFTFGRDTQPVSIVGSPVVSGTVTATMADVTWTPTCVELTITDTATVDTYLLPAKCVGYEFWTVVTTHTLQFIPGAGAVYLTKNPGIPFNTFQLPSVLFAGTLSFKDTTEAGCKVELIIWTKP